MNSLVTSRVPGGASRQSRRVGRSCPMSGHQTASSHDDVEAGVERDPRRAPDEARAAALSVASTCGCSRKPMRARCGGPEMRSTMRKRAACLLEAAHVFVAAVAVVRSLHDQPFGFADEIEQADVGPPRAAEGAEELGLIEAVETQRVVRRGGARGAAPPSVDIFIDARIDDDALAGEAQLEGENVAMRMRRQRVRADAAAIGDETVAALAPPEITGVGIGEGERRRRPSV